MDWTTALVSLAVGLLGGGGIVAYLKAGSENRVNDAKAWAELIDRLNSEVTRLGDRVKVLETEQAAKDERIKSLEDEVEARDNRIAALERQVIRLNVELAQFRTVGA